MSKVIKFLSLVVLTLLLFGCSPSQNKNKEPNYIIVNSGNQSGDVRIPRAYVIGADRGSYPIQRFDYQGKTFLLYKESIIEVQW
jgi:hypothetical protein